ncbi:MAG: universal stress protein [Saprospiraceae bacterium]|nr:universal stress protein [Saprospiraceae bacterium]
MKDINTILVASELNNESYEALTYGITLGLMFDAKVCCIHVVKPSPIDIVKETFQIGSSKYGEALKSVKEESQNLLGHIIDIIGQELGVGELDVDLKIVSGSLQQSITDYAEMIKADLVVICTEPATKFLKSQHTNLALSMIDSGKTNVLLIPSGFKMERIEQIGAFVNFKVDDIQFIYRLINLAAKTEYGLKCINVARNEKEAEKIDHLLKKFERLFSDVIKSRKVVFEVEIGDIPVVVNSIKAKQNIDLMVIRAHEHHWDMYSSISSFSDKVIKNIKSPLLVLKNREVIKKIVVKE